MQLGLKCLGILKSSMFVEMVKAAFPDLEVITSDFGPSVGAHAGPGAIGFAFRPIKLERNRTSLVSLINHEAARAS